MNHANSSLGNFWLATCQCLFVKRLYYNNLSVSKRCNYSLRRPRVMIQAVLWVAGSKQHAC